MKISLSWISKYTKIPNTIKEKYDLADKFARQIADIDEITHYGEHTKDIVVGKIMKIQNHNNADKLKITHIDIGEKEYIQIVTGATNIYEGMHVPVAKIGVTLPNGLTIEKRDLRGIPSYGMLCSEKELMLSNDHEGIMDLGDIKDIKVGEYLLTYLEDLILDIDNKVISNRGDLFSHEGIAREIAALQKTEYIKPEIKKIKIESEKNIDVKIESKNFCFRYTGIIIKNVKIKESPLKIKRALERLGVQSINNIVDITNYIMFDIGQPLHAFDLDKIGGEGTTIFVRQAMGGEKIKTLDQKERILSQDNYLIATKDKPIAIAGVMGGYDSRVDENTKNILIESATFNPKLIRKSSKGINLRTDASLRYEKRVDPNKTKRALIEAIKMIQNDNAGEIASDIVDVITIKDITKRDTLSFSFDRVEKVIGIKIEKKVVRDILERLNFEVKISKDNIISVKIPTERDDIKEDVDLIEDIGRIYGYDKIPLKNPVYEIIPRKEDILYKTKQSIKTIISACGGYEIKTYSFINEDLLKKAMLDNISKIKIINPNSEDYTTLRSSLIPSILKTVSTNQKNADSFILYEIANVYKESKGEELPREEYELVITAYNKKSETFFSVKNIIEVIKEYLPLKGEISYQDFLKMPYLKNKSAKIYFNEDYFGDIGNIHPEIRENFNINGNITISRIPVNNIIKYLELFPKIKPISKYPEIKIDLNITIDNSVSSKSIIESIYDENLRSKNIVDVYKGKPLEENQTGLTIRLVFENFEGTFKTEDIHSKINKIKESINKKYPNVLFR